MMTKKEVKKLRKNIISLVSAYAEDCYNWVIKAEDDFKDFESALKQVLKAIPLAKNHVE